MDLNNVGFDYFYNLALDMFSVLREMICKINKYTVMIIDPIAYSGDFSKGYGFTTQTNEIYLYLGNIIQGWNYDETAVKHYSF